MVMEGIMNRAMALFGGAGVGAGIMYLLDPDRGRRRRALVRDKVVRGVHALGDALDTTSRDLRNRTRGVIAELRPRRDTGPVSDVVLEERVRSALGGPVRHPRSIGVTVRDGRVTLRGPVLADEVPVLLRRVSAVSGVTEVDNQLDVHATAADVPGLQGEGRRGRAGDQFELLQSQWSPTARLFMGLAGGALTALGLRRHGLPGTALALGGLAIAARAATNVELRRLLGVGADPWTVTVQKTLTVAAPIEDVAELWRHDESFPRFMAHVRDVQRLDEGRARWTVAGPAGVPIVGEITARFEPVADGTRIHIQMHYNPPVGAVGHALAALLGADPKRALDEDLVRFKSLLEDGKTSVGGRTVTREALGS
jgi:uncharacterized membrane protein